MAGYLPVQEGAVGTSHCYSIPPKADFFNGLLKEAAMTKAATHKPMPGLAWPGQKVRWRDPGQARAYGWEALFGPGPFVVVRIVDHSTYGLATGLVLRTAIGEQEIPEVWMTLTDEAAGEGVPQGHVRASAGTNPALVRKEVAT